MPDRVSPSETSRRHLQAAHAALATAYQALTDKPDHPQDIEAAKQAIDRAANRIEQVLVDAADGWAVNLNDDTGGKFPLGNG